MVNISHIIFASKLLEQCGCNPNAAIYSLVSNIDDKPIYMKNIYAHTLKNLPKLIDQAINVFGENSASNSYEFKRINEDKDHFLNQLKLSNDWLNKRPNGISENKVEAALCVISHIYFDSFFYPLQFFVPHSPTCSGQWSFWNDIDSLELKSKLNQKEHIFTLRNILKTDSLWKVEMKPDDFSYVVKKRLLKEDNIGKPLDSAALVKAMIIRMGEMATPHLNYEVIDGAIRSFCSFLKIQQYLRVDRELLFLRKFEKNFMEQLKISWKLTDKLPSTHYI